MTARSIVWRFYAYRLSVSNGFYLPVSVLYLQQVRGFGLDDIGLIMGSLSIAILAAEIPTGYVGDRLGRRTALAVGNVFSVAFMAGYVVVESPAGYVALHVVWAVAWAFRSGTADAWLYELLAVAGDEDRFTRVRARAATVELGFEAATAALAGVLVVVVGWGLPFLANAVVAALGIPLLLTSPSVADARAASPSDGDDADSGGDALAEDDDAPAGAGEAFTVREAVRMLRLQAARPEVRWLVVYVALFLGLYSAIRTFEQPALDAAGISVVALGLLYAGFKLVSAGAASTAGWLSDRFGARLVFAALVPVYGVAFLGVAALPALLVPVLFLNRGVRVVIRPIRDQYINDRLENVGRATVLSGASMVTSVVTGVSKIVAGEVSAVIGLHQFLVVAGVATAAAGAVLWLAVSPVRAPEERASTDADGPTPAD